jgi:nitrite reductase (NADH) small subunit
VSAPEVKTSLCLEADLPPGEMRVFTVGRMPILVARKDASTFFAVFAICPHQGADLSKGRFGGTNVASAVGEFRYGRDCELVRCPWHGWEFDLATGRSLHDPERKRVKAYKVTLEGDEVVLWRGKDER